MSDDQAKRVLSQLRGLHGRIVDDVPQLKRGMVWCTVCGHSERVDSVDRLRYGWPKHCGYTMTIDSPDRPMTNDDQAKLGIARVEWSDNVGFNGSWLVLVGDFIVNTYSQPFHSVAIEQAKEWDAAHEEVCPAIKENAELHTSLATAAEMIGNAAQERDDLRAKLAEYEKYRRFAAELAAKLRYWRPLIAECIGMNEAERQEMDALLKDGQP